MKPQTTKHWKKKSRGLGDVGVPAKSLKICFCPVCFFFPTLGFHRFWCFCVQCVFFFVCVCVHFWGFLNGAFPLRVSLFRKSFMFSMCFFLIVLMVPSPKSINTCFEDVIYMMPTVEANDFSCWSLILGQYMKQIRSWYCFLWGLCIRCSDVTTLHLVAHPTNRKWVITPVIYMG